MDKIFPICLDTYKFDIIYKIFLILNEQNKAKKFKAENKQYR